MHSVYQFIMDRKLVTLILILLELKEAFSMLDIP